MPIQVSYKKNINDKLIKNYVLFSDESFKICSLNKISLGKKGLFINELIKKNVVKNKKFLTFNLNSRQRITLISLKKKLTSLNNEEVGAEFYNFIKENSFFNLTFIENNIQGSQIYSFNLNDFLHGIELKSYEFNKYKTKKKNLKIKINISVSKKILFSNVNKKYHAIVSGINFARDLVSEPPNVLTPKEYVNRLVKLRKHG